MSSPSDPEPPVEPGPPQKASTTQEIPVVAPSGATAAGRPRPPHPDAVPPAPVPAPGPAAADAPLPTGPVDFVPGLPGVGTPPRAESVSPMPSPPPPPPVATPTTAEQPARMWPDTLEPDEDEAPAGVARPRKERRARTPRDRAALIGLGLVLLSLVLLELGLALEFDSEPYWTLVPLWSAFATVCVVLALLVFAASFPAGNRLRPGPAWRIAAGGLVGLAVFWLLVVLPTVATDRGFVLTASLAALGGALWIGPRRKD